MCTVWISLNKWQCATIYHDTGCLFHCFLTPSFALLGAIAKSRRPGKLSHSSVPGRQVKTVILSPKLPQLQNPSNSSFCLHANPQHPPLPKEDQDNCHLACHKHLYPSRWLLLTTNCRLGPECTWYCHRTSINCTCLPFWSLWCCVRKMVQVAVSCLNCTTDPPRMFINGERAWYILGCPSLQMTPCKRILAAVIWTTHWDNVLASDNQV